MKLEDIYTTLNKALPGRVYYGTNVYDNEDNASMPYIVYQEISKRAIGYADDVPLTYVSSIQITLVTSKKDVTLERRLEKELLNNNLSYSLLSEFFNSDKSVNRVYEIKTEE